MLIRDTAENQVQVDNLTLEFPKLDAGLVHTIIGYMHSQVIDFPSVYRSPGDGEINLTRLAEAAWDEYYTLEPEPPEFLFELAYIAVNTVTASPSGLDEVIYE